MKDKTDYEVIVVGAGVSGIYQIKLLTDLGFDAMVLEGDQDLGGTWYRNRYPCCRFDSESYTYGYSFSTEVLEQWHWKERFSAQPETLRYLNFVADKFDLRRHMRFNARVKSMRWNEAQRKWHLSLNNGDVLTTRFVISAMGVLSTPTLPKYEAMDEFEGRSFHTYYWPKEPVELEGKRVAVVGTGATGIQLIPAIADKVGSLTVFQRRPNWSTPLNNSVISEQEMAEIRARYDEIFTNCSISPNGFEHTPDRRGIWNLTAPERKEFWDELYATHGFAISAANFTEIFLEEDANKELSDYVAARIRDRVKDPEVAEKLIPRDHGFATQRLPLETNYFEAYNRDNVKLVDVTAEPIQKITAKGIQTSDSHYDLDLIIYATGFDAITGAWDKVDVKGVDGKKLKDKWSDVPATYFGLSTNDFPNMFMISGPQGIAGSTNFPRAIEVGVEWISDLLVIAREKGYSRLNVQTEGERQWQEKVVAAHERLLSRNSKGWFTGYNSNVEGREVGKVRYHAFFGGVPQYKKLIGQAAAEGYKYFDMS
jgi:cation diffusion facilitator CzcD-associated flavoprotein CzcO